MVDVLSFLSIPLPVQTSILNSFRDVFGLDLFAVGEITNCSGDFKYPNKDLLYTTYEYPEFVPVVTIKWDELAGIP